MEFIKKFKKWILSSFVVVLLAGSWFVGDYFYNFALNPKVNKDRVSNQDYDGVEDERKPVNMKWFEENAKEHDMKSVTGVNVKGYTFTHENGGNGKWVVVTHGFFISAKQAANYVRGFYDRGYNVFAPDLIGHGKSEGEAYSMGGYDSSDLVNWVKKISAENNNPDIVLFGMSMGAATTMNSLNKGLPENVKGFIEDSGYVSLHDEFSYQLDRMFGLPTFPVIPLANFVTGVKAGYNFGDVDATEALKLNKLPALILHGEQDGYVPLSHGQKAYDLLTSYKEIHIFKDAKHVKAERKYNEEYWRHIENFLAKAYSGDMTATAVSNNTKNGTEQKSNEETLKNVLENSEEKGTVSNKNEGESSSSSTNGEVTSGNKSQENNSDSKEVLPSTKAVVKRSS